MRLSCVLVAIAIGVNAAVAQNSTPAKPYALPPPPIPQDDPLSGVDIRYSRTKSAEANESSRRAILQRLEVLQQQLKQLDRARAQRALASPEAVQSPDARFGTTEARSDIESRAAVTNRVIAVQRNLGNFDIESVCGPTDDSQEVELYDGSLGPPKDFVRERQPATGQIQWNSNFSGILTATDDPGNVANQRWCSGTLISDRLFVTAGHCFDSHSNDETGWNTPRRRIGNDLVSLAPQELAPLMHINFNYQIDAATRQPRTPDTFPIVKLLEHRQGQLDYAIVEIGPNSSGQLPTPRYPAESYDASAIGLAQARTLTIIQHPMGAPKRIAAGIQLKFSDGKIFYSDIDTYGGSSGSGIIDDRGRLIGVHTNGGCTAIGGQNFGVSLQAISQVSHLVR